MSKQVELDITIPNQTKYLGMIGRIGESLAYSLKAYHGNRREFAYHLNLVLTEALANAICHGCDPNKDVKLWIGASDEKLVIRVFDQGQGFDIDALARLRAKSHDEGGRGIEIILKLMDHVTYTQEGDRNVLEMTKYLH